MIKDKVHPRRGHEGSEGEQRYSSTLSLTSALDGVGVQRHAPAALPPGKTRYPLYRRLGGPQGRSGHVRKNLAPTGIRSPDRPAGSESLYRLSYRGPHNNQDTKISYFVSANGRPLPIILFFYELLRLPDNGRISRSDYAVVHIMNT